MATVKAPKPATMDAIHDKSVVSYSLSGTTATFYNRAGDVVGIATVRIPNENVVPAIARIGSVDFGYRDVLVKDWFNPAKMSTKIPVDPSPAPTGPIRELSWSPDGYYIAITQGNPDGCHIYSRVGDIFTRVYTSPSVGSEGVHLAWSPNGKYITYSVDAGTLQPRVVWLKNTSGTFSRLTTGVPDWANSGGSGVSEAPFIRWSPDSNYVILFQSDYQTHLYKRSGDAFTLLTDTGLPLLSDCVWSPNGQYLATLSNSSPYSSMYKQVGDKFVRLSANGIGPEDFSGQVAWSPDSTYLVGATGANPPFALYKRTGDNFVRKTSVGYLPWMSSTTGLQFTPDGKYVLSVFGGFFGFYQIVNDVIVPVPSAYWQISPAAAYGSGVAFSPDGKHLAFGMNNLGSPKLTIYKSAMGPVKGLASRII